MIRAYCQDQRGAAAVEFAMMLGLFVIALPSVIDLGIYAYDTIQVQNSAQMAAQAVWAACSKLPASNSSNCSTAYSAMTTAAQNTSLGNKVSVTSASEGYYCTTQSSGQLVLNGTAGSFTGTALSSTPASACSTSTYVSAIPGDYVSATVTYTYTPVFAGISVANLLGTSITSTAWLRLL